MKKSKSSAVVAIIAVGLLIVAGFYVYFEYFPEEEPKKQKELEKKVIDNQISPLENQGLVIEINRIRHRGLYDKLKTIGNSWKNKPTFYFKTNMDGTEYSSKNVETHGRTEEIVFNTWDTMFQENKIVRDANEEQLTSTVTLTIVEQVESGLIFKKTNEVDREQITVEYDYRTGRWSGDDYFKDYDGYGHYLGDTFEIWFNLYQMDFDHDYIPYWTEVNVLGTDPRSDDSNKDPDGDGIPTTWEWKWGYDPLIWDDHEKLDPDMDGVENVEEYQMEKWFADPYIQDVYVEIDVMEGTGLLDPTRCFFEECQQAIIEKYAEHNLRLYFDTGWPNSPKNGGGDILPSIRKVSQDSGMILQFYNNYFPDERKGIFRYIVLGQKGGFNHPSVGNVYDSVYIPFNQNKLKPIQKIRDIVMFGKTPTERGYRIALAAAAMHELGHSIGIAPWGFEGVDNISYGLCTLPNKEYMNKWGNYWSVMNYQCIYDTHLLDYSDGSNGPPYDQNDWMQLYVASFQYTKEVVEEAYFEPPSRDKIVWGETEFGVTGYSYDENLSNSFAKSMAGWSPVDPIDANWRVFKIDDKEANPNNNEIKVFVQPRDVAFAYWCEYIEGNLDSEDNMMFYSQQDLVDEVMAEIS